MYESASGSDAVTSAAGGVKYSAPILRSDWIGRKLIDSLRYAEVFSLAKDGSYWVSRRSNDSANVHHLSPSGNVISIHSFGYVLNVAAYDDGAIVVGGDSLGVHKVYRIHSDGTIEELFRSGRYEGGIYAVAVDQRKRIYFNVGLKVLRMTLGGKVEVVAGNGNGKNDYDTIGDALHTGWNDIVGLACGKDDAFYIATYWHQGCGIWKIDKNYCCRRIAGGGVVEDEKNAGLQGRDVKLDVVRKIVEKENGDLCWSDGFDAIRCVNKEDGSIYFPAAWFSMFYPCGFDFDQFGMMFVLENHVWNYDPNYNNNGSLVILDSHGFNANTYKKRMLDDGNLGSFDILGRLMYIESPLAGDTLRSFRYDDSLQLRAIIERNGDSIVYSRESGALVVKGPKRTGSLATRLEKDAEGNVTKAILPDGRFYTMGYGKGGLLTEFVKPNGAKNVFTYDEDGQLISDSVVGGGAQRITETTVSGVRTVTRTDAAGVRKSYAKWSSGDTTIRSTEMDGVRQITKTLANGYRKIIHPDSSVEEYIPHQDPQWGTAHPLYDEIRCLPDGTKQTIHRGASIQLLDEKNRLTLVFRADTTVVGSAVYVSEWTTATRTRVDKGPSGVATTTRYDKLDRVVEVKVGDSTVQTASYNDTTGLETWIRSGVITKVWRNANGQIDSVQGADGERLRYIRDADNQPTAIPQSGGGQVGLRWDDRGRLVGLTPWGKGEHQFLYNSWGGDSLYIPPVVGGKDGQVGYSYDEKGRLKTVRYSDADSVVASFDNKSRWSNLTLKDGSVDYTYTGDNPLFTSATRSLPGGTSQGLALKLNGSRIDGETWSGAVAGSVERTWTVNQTLGGLSVNGDRVNYAWGLDGHLLQAGDATYQQDPLYARLRRIDLGDLKTDLSYDQSGFGPLIADTLRYQNLPLYAQRLGYDASGRIDNKTEFVWIRSGISTSIDSTRWQYGYTNGRLTTVLKNGVTEATYAWDSNGNRLHSSVDAQDRLVLQDDAQWSYDAIGHLKRRIDNRGVWDFHYDALWNLLSAKGTQTIDYVVDARGRRVGRKVNGALVQGFLYGDQLEPVAELDGSSQVVSRFVYGSRPHVPDYMIKAGVKYRLVTDHLGSVRLVVNATTGETVSRIDYDVWGQVTHADSLSFQPFGFAGGLRDDATGLVRFGARDYDPHVGRWTAKDPIGFGGSEGDLYGYVGSDPVNGIDPTGKFIFSREFISQYPKAYRRLKSLSLRISQKQYDAFSKWGGACTRDVNAALKDGSGPNVIASPLDPLAGWFDHDRPYAIQIDAQLLERYQFSEFSDLYFDATAEHELTHYFAYKNGISSSTIEYGEMYETDVYGGVQKP